MQRMAVDAGVEQCLAHGLAAVNSQQFVQQRPVGPRTAGSGFVLFHTLPGCAGQETVSLPTASAVTLSADSFMRIAISSMRAPDMGRPDEPATKHIMGICLNTKTGTEIVLTS